MVRGGAGWVFRLSFFVFAFATSYADVRVSERVFNFRIPASEPETLDWNLAHTQIEAPLMMNLMEGLVAYDGLRVVPSLATWRVSPDQKTYIFTLKPGVLWSDGVPLKAKDFVTSWKRLLSPVMAASYAYLLFDIQGAEAFNQGKDLNFENVGIRATDEQTLTVTLKYPLAHWIHIPAFWATFPLRQDILEKYGDSWTTPGRMVTVGPFVLISHDLNSNFMLKSNAFYHGARGNLDRVNVHMVKDDRQAFKMYQSGALDFVTDLATVDLKQVQKNVIRFPHLKTEYLSFVTSKFPVSNKKIRRAIAMAIDKEQLSKVVHGGQTPAHAFVPPPLLGSSELQGLPFDLKRAQYELRSSGLYEPGKPIHLSLAYPNWDKVQQIVDFLKTELKKNLDIELELNPMENQTFRVQLDLHAKPMSYGTWTADFPDPDNFLSIFQGSSGNNRTTWVSAEYDDLLKKARVVSNRAERTRMVERLQKILLDEEAVVIPLFYAPHLALIRPGVTGLRLNAMDYLYLKNVSIKN